MGDRYCTCLSRLHWFKLGVVEEIGEEGRPSDFDAVDDEDVCNGRQVVLGAGDEWNRELD